MSDCELLRGVIESVRKSDFAPETPIVSTFGEDGERLVRALWELIEQGEDLSDLASVPLILSSRPVAAEPLFRYMKQLSAANPYWARLGGQYTRGTNYQGWNMDLEMLLRACSDRRSLAKNWASLAEPVQGCVAFALGRLGDLPAEALPESTLPRFAEAMCDVYDWSVHGAGVRGGHYQDAHAAFEGADKLFGADAWFGAVRDEALRADRKDSVAIYPANLRPIMDRCTPAQRARLICNLTWSSDTLHYLEEVKEEALADADLRSDVKNIAEVTAESRHSASAEQKIILGWYLSRHADPELAKQEPFRSAREAILSWWDDGAFIMLQALPERDRDAKLIPLLKPGFDARYCWETAHHFSSPAVLKHAARLALERPDQTSITSMLVKVGKPALDALLKETEEGEPRAEKSVGVLLAVAENVQSEEACNIALRELDADKDYIVHEARAVLKKQRAADLLRHLDEIFAKDPRFAVELLLRKSHDIAARNAAKELHVKHPSAALAWASELEPSLERLVSGQADSSLLERLRRAQFPDDEVRTWLEKGDLDTAANLDAAASTVCQWALLQNAPANALWELALWLAPRHEGFALAALKWFYPLPPPAEDLGITLHTLEGRSFHFSTEADRAHPGNLLREVKLSESLVAVVEDVLDRQVWPNEIVQTALERIAYFDPERAMPRICDAAASDALRETAISLLVRHRTQSQESLLQLLIEGNAAQRDVAISAIQRAPDACFIEALQKLETGKERDKALEVCRVAAAEQDLLKLDFPTRQAEKIAQPLDVSIDYIEAASAADAITIHGGSQLIVIDSSGKTLLSEVGVGNVLISMAADGKAVAIAEEFDITCYPLDGGEPSIIQPDDGLHGMFALNGQRVVSLCAAPNAYTPLMIWEHRSGSEQSITENTENAIVVELEGMPWRGVVLADGERFAASCTDGGLAVYDTVGKKQLVLIPPMPEDEYSDELDEDEQDEDVNNEPTEPALIALVQASRHALICIDERATLMIFSTHDGRELLREPNAVQSDTALFATPHSDLMMMQTVDEDAIRLRLFAGDGTPLERLRIPNVLVASLCKDTLALVSEDRLYLLDQALKPVAVLSADDDDPVRTVAAYSDGFYFGTASGALYRVTI